MDAHDLWATSDTHDPYLGLSKRHNLTGTNIIHSCSTPFLCTEHERSSLHVRNTALHAKRTVRDVQYETITSACCMSKVHMMRLLMYHLGTQRVYIIEKVMLLIGVSEKLKGQPNIFRGCMCCDQNQFLTCNRLPSVLLFSINSKLILHKILAPYMWSVAIFSSRIRFTYH